MHPRSITPRTFHGAPQLTNKRNTNIVLTKSREEISDETRKLMLNFLLRIQQIPRLDRHQKLLKQPKQLGQNGPSERCAILQIRHYHDREEQPANRIKISDKKQTETSDSV